MKFILGKAAETQGIGGRMKEHNVFVDFLG
jgi:hypothetical protein